MRIVIVGTGNVATVLGRLVQKKGHDIIQVLGHHIENAGTLAREFHCHYSDLNGIIDTTADLSIIAIKDSALYELPPGLYTGNKLMVHTAGSISKDVLRELSVNYGVLYPLQSLQKAMEPDIEIPLLVDGSNAETIRIIHDFAHTLSGSVQLANDEERLKMHVAAVIVNNFSNHLYALAEAYCIQEKLDFKMLIPLIRETAERTAVHSPSLVQTGPAQRKDMLTVEKHLQLLNAHPKLKNIYLKLTESIMNR